MRAEAERLIVILGWGIDDFISECEKASAEVLNEALRILEEPSPIPTIAETHLEQKASGIRAIHRELNYRSAKPASVSWTPCDVAYTRRALGDAGLLQAGTALKFADRTYVIVGDINERGGLCDDCSAFDEDHERVVAYTRISLVSL